MEKRTSWWSGGPAERRLQRRALLELLGAGLGLASSLRLSRWAAAQPAGRPKRLFIFFMPHGIAPEHYNPRLVGGDPSQLDLDATGVSILGPLQPYRDQVVVYQGLQYPGQASTHTGIVNCLSGVTATDTTTRRRTVEHVVGQALGITPLILGACSHLPYGLDANGMLFWDDTPIDPEKSPVAAFDRLFPGTGSGAAAPSPDAALRRELLALTAGELEALRTAVGDLTRERSKLQAHLEAVQALQQSAGGGVSACAARPSLPAVEEVRAASVGSGRGANDYFYQERNFPLLLRAQLQLAAQALICNAAPIIGLQAMFATCDFDFGFMGVPGAHHNTLSHTNPQQNPRAQWNSPLSEDNYLPEPRAPFARAQRWFTQQLVDHVVAPLASADDPADPGRKVLDNTLILCVSEVGDGQHHTRISQIQYPQVPSHLPFFTVGGAGGGLRPGRVVRAPIGKSEEAPRLNRPAADLYLTIARALGAREVSFPGATGPFQEVLA